jgi:hypothetical protein
MTDSSKESKQRYKKTVKGKRSKKAYDEKVFKTPEGRATRMIAQTRVDARRADRVFELDKQWLLEKLRKGFCEKTGLPFVLNGKEDNTLNQKTTKHPFSPSLERKNSNIGYTKENTLVVCLIYNYCKNVFEEEAVEMFCRAYLNKIENNNGES